MMDAWLPPFAAQGSRWLTLTDGGQTVWVNLDHVRQVLFCDADPEPTALLWCRDDLWEIADPAGLAALRRYLHGRALTAGQEG